jgi:hypothetical protein
MFWQVVHPEEGLLLGVVSVPCHKHIIICLSWNPRGLQSDCSENGLEQRQIQNGGEMPCFSPKLVNSWAQGVSAFQQKQFDHLLQNLIIFPNFSDSQLLL